MSESSPTYGDQVTVRTNVQRTSLADLLYGVRSDVPSCFERVAGTTRGQASGGALITESNSQFSFSGNRANWSGPGVGPGFWMETDYRVLCGAGSVPTGGAEFASVAGQYRGSMSLGPTITVRRMGTSVFLAQPTNPEVGQQVTLRVTTSGVPDGGQVVFTVDGQNVGSATVSANQATLPWVPSGAGAKQIRASVAQTGTHGGSVSQVRDVIVSPSNVASTVTVVAVGSPKVGLSTRLTATVSPAGAGGEVVFLDEGSQIGAAPVGADGTASIDWVPSAGGERTIDATFSGRSGVAPSNGAIPVTVAAADPSNVATTTTLDPITTTQVGRQIMLRAAVDAGMAGGIVSFYDGNELIGTAPVQPDGTASLPWNPTTDGERTIRALFSGHGVYLSSQDTRQAIITPKTVNPEPEPTEPATGSLGSLTSSLDGGGGVVTLSSLGT
ncbi:MULTISPECIES: Ig-like domain-containing protein [unclassified Dietzia]|uniref:Ig-like domain-containing protein n=1 Tax=unclassified Dietzia TaxID=2617939 RepID=UPI0015FB6A90|nr:MULTISPECIES: Ig-like domain-containing protein [unclassified Dietzia]MBB1023804.1 Ig-like domain repeat protein [Dietzia sp. DQ12-76]MBB1028811.1 Ig-like domain repeat protein [Dietzia sp. DQ11-38-2]